MKHSLVAITVCSLLLSCTSHKANKEDIPVARVYDKYLYNSDLEDVVPNELSDIDSLTLVKDYIGKWVRKQLLLFKAETNLSEDDKNVEKQIDDYRTSLLVFKYEQSLIQQKLDTVITDKEVEKYFNENSSNFILNEHLVKALFIKVPRTAPDLWKLKRWCTSDDEGHLKELEAYCYNNAEKYDYFNDDWVEFKVIEEQLPKLYTNYSNILKSRNIYETWDQVYYYFVRFYDYKLEGTVAPLDYVENKIRSIIMNKRKIQYIKKLEAEVYNDALNHGNFNIY
jgi:hypothetical protein